MALENTVPTYTQKRSLIGPSLRLVMPPNNLRFPLDTKLIMLYTWNASMDSTPKWAGESDNTRALIRGREGGRPPQSGIPALPMHSSFRSASCLDAAPPAGVQGGKGQTSARPGLAQCPAGRFQHLKLPPTFYRGKSR